VGVLTLLGLAVSSRPTMGETAIAVDREAGLGDRAASAPALAVAFPEAAGPHPVSSEGAAESAAPVALDPEAERHDFVRRQRRDTVGALRTAPANLFRPRLSKHPAGAALVALLLLAPVLLIPNPQDVAIAQARQVREEAKAQADRIEKLADDLEKKGATADDPRPRLARELRDLAKELREHPDQLQANL